MKKAVKYTLTIIGTILGVFFAGYAGFVWGIG